MVRPPALSAAACATACRVDAAGQPGDDRDTSLSKPGSDAPGHLPAVGRRPASSNDANRNVVRGRNLPAAVEDGWAAGRLREQPGIRRVGWMENADASGFDSFKLFQRIDSPARLNELGERSGVQNGAQVAPRRGPRHAEATEPGEQTLDPGRTDVRDSRNRQPEWRVRFAFHADVPSFVQRVSHRLPCRFGLRIGDCTSQRRSSRNSLPTFSSAPIEWIVDWPGRYGWPRR